MKNNIDICHIRMVRFSTDEKNTSTTEPNSSDSAKVEVEVEEEDILAESRPEDEFIAQLQKEIKDLRDKVIRSYAEEENVRRIAKRDVESARNYANSSFAKALCDVADDLERALSSVPKDKLEENPDLKNLYIGVEMTEKQLQKVFQQFKVQQFAAVGDRFDPSLHDALFQVADPTRETGTILQVLKKGYKLQDRVIRAAQVGTVNNP
jgi:molecular chaperone GrpE